MADFLFWCLAGGLAVLTVLIHYETMLLISDRLVPWVQKHFHGRRVIAVAIAALFGVHVVEIWCFAVTIMVLVHMNLGNISGNFDDTFSSYLYFSASNYTSLGNSEQPQGFIRCIAAAETLVGMMMIGWSSSFTYLKMEQVWKHHKRE